MAATIGELIAAQAAARPGANYFTSAETGRALSFAEGIERYLNPDWSCADAGKE